MLSLAKGDKVPIGGPVDNTRAYILDENLNPVEEGQRGSLYISGVCGGSNVVGGGGGFCTDDPDGRCLPESGWSALLRGQARFTGIVDYCTVLLRL